jgi:putative ABC transport system permease protein
MFVAWRDLRHARGRFLLMATVVALLSILVGFLSGLTGGLAFQNISAMLAVPGDRVVVSTAGGTSRPTFADSAITATQAGAWADVAGVRSAQPVGMSQLRAQAGDASLAVAVLASDVAIGGGPSPARGTVVVSAPAAAALHVAVGDTLSVAGETLTVAALGDDAWYSHTPVLYTTLEDWQALMAAAGQPHAYATALLVTGGADWAEVDRAAGTTSQGRLQALTLLPAFQSEVGSLLMIIALLFAISALVVGAFFAVWTIQRRGDVAILKALGADNRTLLRDGLGQASVLLAVGIAAGTLAVTAAGLAMRGALPFLLSPLTTLAPAALMTVLGLAGAALALRSISSAEPLTALGSNR